MWKICQIILSKVVSLIVQYVMLREIIAIDFCKVFLVYGQSSLLIVASCMTCFCWKMCLTLAKKFEKFEILLVKLLNLVSNA